MLTSKFTLSWLSRDLLNTVFKYASLSKGLSLIFCASVYIMLYAYSKCGVSDWLCVMHL